MLVLWLVFCAPALALSPTPKTAAADPDPVLVGAGDIADCGSPRDEQTATLLDDIPGTVFTIGDNAYEAGSLADYNNCYGPSWGRHKARTRPAVGNHEYQTTGAAGHFTYWGAAASPLDTNCTANCRGYYSYDLGAWHIIVLNSEIAHTANSAQVQWLRADLAANPTSCTLAYWHKPRFSSGNHGNSASFDPFWQALYEFRADVVLNGHSHNYERFARQNPAGQADAQGIREFVVGTGGRLLIPIVAIQPNSEVRNADTFGVLKLTLHAAGYSWNFVPVAGQTFTDSGTAECVRSVGGRNLEISAPEPAVNLTWDTGNLQADYIVARAQLVPAGGTTFSSPLPANSTSYTDPSPPTNSLLCYQVMARDAQGATLGLSDSNCAYTGFAGGTVIPGGFTLGLNQSATATLTWAPPTGGPVHGYALYKLPFDGSPITFEVLGAGATSTAQNMGATDYCYILVAFRSVAFGNTNLVCGRQGFSSGQPLGRIAQDGIGPGSGKIVEVVAPSSRDRPNSQPLGRRSR